MGGDISSPAARRAHQEYLDTLVLRPVDNPYSPFMESMVEATIPDSHADWRDLNRDG